MSLGAGMSTYNTARSSLPSVSSQRTYRRGWDNHQHGCWHHRRHQRPAFDWEYGVASLPRRPISDHSGLVFRRCRFFSPILAPTACRFGPPNGLFHSRSRLEGHRRVCIRRSCSAGAGGWTTNFAAIRLCEEHRVIRRAGLDRAPRRPPGLNRSCPSAVRREDGNGSPQC